MARNARQPKLDLGPPPYRVDYRHSLIGHRSSVASRRANSGLPQAVKLSWQAVIVLTMLIGMIGLSLAVLHGIEAALWAEAYLLLGALDTPAEAMLFSIDSMTTRDASGLTLHQHW